MEISAIQNQFYGSFGGAGSVGRPFGDGPPEFINKMLSDFSVDPASLFDEQGNFSSSALIEALEGNGQAFQDQAAAAGIEGGRPPFPPPNFDPAQFQDQIAALLEEQGLDSIFNEDGSIDTEALGQLLQSVQESIGGAFSGVALGGPPQGGGYGGQLGSDTLTSLLEMLSTDNNSEEEDSGLTQVLG